MRSVLSCWPRQSDASVTVLMMMAFAVGLMPAFADTPEDIISAHTMVFDQALKRTPSKSSVDAPLMGNGDMAVCVGGDGTKQTYYLNMNDFWRLENQYGKSMPKSFGTLEISIPSLEGADFSAEQTLYTPSTTVTSKKEDITVTQRSWVAATKNILIVELSVHGGDIPIAVLLKSGQTPDKNTSNERDYPNGIDREFKDDVDQYTRTSAVLRIAPKDQREFVLRPGSPLTLVLGMSSYFESALMREHQEYMQSENPDKEESGWPQHIAECADWLTEQAIVPTYREKLFDDHAVWWANFWSKSWIDIDDDDIERQYYVSNYVMGCASRNPKFPPGIFGPWVTTNKPAWFGDYHLNYNHMAPYYGLYSSNHLEQADPYHAPIIDFMERGKWYAKEILKQNGVYYPVGIGPLGIETTRNSTYDEGKHNEKGGLFFGQKSNAAYACVNLAMRWYRTYDLDYAKEVYPFVREAAIFWEEYLTYENKRYVIYGDSVHEGSGTDMNSIVTLGLVRNVMELAIDMSTELDIDLDKQRLWNHIVSNLSGFATQRKGASKVFRYTEKGTAWWPDNTLGIQHIYPAGAIGLESDSALLRLSHNTINVMDRWHDSNGMNSFFPAAVRVGYKPETIFKELRTYVTKNANTNGFAKNNPHGIENCSIVPNTINEMMCMGHQGVLRFFPVWPKKEKARFKNLRAEGAFLCSGEFSDGEVASASIISERGRDCTLDNPWPKASVLLRRNGHAAETLSGKRFTFSTEQGERIELVKQTRDN
jgi:alpha-L-fucosidase 2